MLHSDHLERWNEILVALSVSVRLRRCIVLCLLPIVPVYIAVLNFRVNHGRVRIEAMFNSLLPPLAGSLSLEASLFLSSMAVDPFSDNAPITNDPPVRLLA